MVYPYLVRDKCRKKHDAEKGASFHCAKASYKNQKSISIPRSPYSERSTKVDLYMVILKGK